MQTPAQTTVLRIRSFLKINNKSTRSGALKLLEVLSRNDVENTGFLNWKQFSEALISCGLQIQDVKMLFKYCDKNGRNEVDVQSFLRIIRGPFSTPKKLMVSEIFHIFIDKDGDGLATIEDILKPFLAHKHPDARLGRRSPAKIIADFTNDLLYFSADGYYNYSKFLSLFDFLYCFENDADFTDLMKTLWTKSTDIDTGIGSVIVHDDNNLSSSLSMSTIQLDPKTIFINRMRAFLQVRGIRGLKTLKQCFKKYGENGKLNLYWFKKALKDASFSLPENAVNQVFFEYDQNKRGYIDNVEILNDIIGTLSNELIELIDIVFDSIDYKNEGKVNIDYLLQKYDASRHPDVLAGKKTALDEHKDFVDGFINGGSSSGNNQYDYQLNKSTFLDYYQSLAAVYGDKEYFISVVKSTWHITDEMMHAFQVKKYTPPPLPMQNKVKGALDRFTSSNDSSKPLPIYSWPEPNDSSPTGQPSLPDRRNAWKEVMLRDTEADNSNGGVNGGVHFLLKKVRTELFLRGRNGILNFQRRLRTADTRGDKKLDIAEFTSFLNEILPAMFTATQIREVFDYLDADTYERRVAIDVIMKAMRPPLGDKSKRLLAYVFDRLDRDGSSAVDAHEVAGSYDPSRHPDVVAGKRSAEAEYRDFLDSFDVGGEVEGKVTRAEFMNYYSNIYASILDEDVFYQLVGCTWLSPEDFGSFEAQYAELQATSDMRGSRNNPLMPTNSSMSRQPYNIISLSQNKGSAQSVPAAQKTLLPMPITKESASIYDSNSKELVDVNGGMAFLLKKAAQTLCARGKFGFINFQRKMKAVDTDGDKKLTVSQFIVFMRDALPNLFTENELRRMFDFFDVHSATVDARRLVQIEHIMSALRSPLSETSRRLLAFIFDHMDKDGTGMVDAHEVAGSYDPSRHPDVVAGKRSAEAEYRDFLDSFDVGGEVEGKVIQSEFMNYYANMFAGMRDEAAFLQVLSATWLATDASAPGMTQSGTDTYADPSQLNSNPANLPNSTGQNHGHDHISARHHYVEDDFFGSRRVRMYDGSGPVKNWHQHKSAVIFPEADTSAFGRGAGVPVDEEIYRSGKKLVPQFVPPEEKHGKRHTQVRKSEIFFSAD